MSRSARITVLELGASPRAWASCPAAGADDWVVVAQQSDEDAADFTRRVQKRAQRLCKDDTQIAAVDVYAGPGGGRDRSDARREVIAELGIQLATGGRLTLWSASDDAPADAEMTAILAQFGPLLAER
ncbi:MAG TPA: hypothetical protein VJV79_21300, partial [Polyangiaceae bacterium]|nr:hypothetical protein [Polyangiaceae bacterium]